MLLVPTRGRPENLRRFLAACLDTGVSTPIVCRLDKDDGRLPEYRSCLDWAQKAIDVRHVTGAPLGFGGKINHLFRLYPDASFYACMQDDVVPLTPLWDTILAEACKGGIAYPDDGLQRENLPTNPFIDGGLARRMGFLAMPMCWHWFIDNAWKDIGHAVGHLRYVPDVLIEHRHWANHKAPVDPTYQGAAERSAEDKEAYRLWRAFEFPVLAERMNVG